MSFSILFKSAEVLTDRIPDCFHDLHLDRITDNVTKGRDDYRLNEFFYSPLQKVEDIIYRQQVFRDMEQKEVSVLLEHFTTDMERLQQSLDDMQKTSYELHHQRLFLDAVSDYCNAVKNLLSDFSVLKIQSEGLMQFREFLIDYLQSDAFILLNREAEELLNDLQQIRYNIVIRGLRIQVLPFKEQPDYTVVIENTFSKFRHHPQKDYRVKFENEIYMNSVEAKILSGVASLYPQIFERLKLFNEVHKDFRDKTILAFVREIQFYIGWMQYLRELKKQELPFCYPQMLTDSKAVQGKSAFDLALAKRLSKERKRVVLNDFYLKENERIIIITGPNQGGKTTFVRMFGQLHYLARLGCPVPGGNAKLFLYDSLFTHFEKEEIVNAHASKLEDDLVRIHEMLTQATSRSILLLNEIFSSTTLNDALFLNKKLIETVDRLDMICLCVTFMDVLLGQSKKTVSMVSNVEPENPDRRTFKVIRKPADGLAYALSVARKHGVTYSQLKERLKS